MTLQRQLLPIAAVVILEIPLPLIFCLSAESANVYCREHQSPRRARKAAPAAPQHARVALWLPGDSARCSVGCTGLGAGELHAVTSQWSSRLRALGCVCGLCGEAVPNL
jgi:hypothetical protein